jgi:outer membrane protein OmpA-like peptidoglycan-associated protein
MKSHRTSSTDLADRPARQTVLAETTHLSIVRRASIGAILATALASVVFITGCSGGPRCSGRVDSFGTRVSDDGTTWSRSNAGTEDSRNVRPEGANSAIGEGDILFTVRAPKLVPVERRVRETFPLRNYVFFDEGSNDLPNRYVDLTKDQATSFTEAQLQEIVPEDMVGRSRRQMVVYYNILNILGDRMRANPSAAVSLSGASANGPQEGRVLAEAVKEYLVSRFGIDGARISTDGRDKPRTPSEHAGGTKELTLLRAEDRRVDIESRSPELLMQVGGPPDMLKPVQIIAVQQNPMDSRVLFQVTGAGDVLSSWSLEITGEQGNVQHYGPYVRDQESIAGHTILGNQPDGNFKVVMLGTTRSGSSVRRESSVYLVRPEEEEPEGLRFSILFEFDKSKTIDTYKSFLTEMVAPLVPTNGRIIIHGHTDDIGETAYNYALSDDRAQGAQGVIRGALTESVTRGVLFDTYGFGEDAGWSPFENGLPEERFYNRTVIIDFVPSS